MQGRGQWRGPHRVMGGSEVGIGSSSLVTLPEASDSRRAVPEAWGESTFQEPPALSRSLPRAASASQAAVGVSKSTRVRRRAARVLKQRQAEGKIASMDDTGALLAAAGRGSRVVFAVNQVPDSLLEHQVIDLSQWSILVDSSVLFRLASMNEARAEAAAARAEARARKLSSSKSYVAASRAADSPLPPPVMSGGLVWADSSDRAASSSSSLLTHRASETLQHSSRRRPARKMFSTSAAEMFPVIDPVKRVAPSPIQEDETFRSTVVHTLIVPRAEGADDGAVKAVADSSHGLFRALDARGAPNLSDIGLRAVALASPGLESLLLDNCKNVKGAGLAAVADCCPKLTTLSVAGCNWLPPWVLSRIGSGCPSLEVLNLSDLNKMNDDDLRSCVRSATSLTEVSLQRCTMVSDPGVLAVAQAASGLRKLNLERSDLPYKVTDVALLALAQHCVNLTELNLHNCEKISDSGLSWLSGTCHALQTLDIRGCSKVTDVGMRTLSEGLPLLQRLRIAGCKRVGDVGIRHLAAGCPELTELDLGGLFLLKDGTPRSFAREGLQALLHARPRLRALNLGGCTQVADRIISSLPGAFPDLEQLALSCCLNVSPPALQECLGALPRLTSVNLRGVGAGVSDGVLAALAFCSGPRLSSLDVAECTDVTDRGVAAVSKRCRGLMSLDLAGCTRLTDLSLFSLADADMYPGLRKLSFEGCDGVTETGVSWVAMRCTTICDLNLRGCSVSKTGLESMASAFPHALLAANSQRWGFLPAPRASERQEIALYGQTWAAAAKIQALVRSMRARQEVKALREERLREWLAVRLQSCWRGQQGRAVAVRMIWEERRRHAQVNRIQAAYRGWVARKEVRDMREQLELLKIHKYATQIQRVFRGHQGRKRVKRMREEIQERRRRRQASSVVVQRIFRGWSARQRFKLIKAADRARRIRLGRSAQEVQRLFRGYRGRKRAHARKSLLEEEEAARERAATMIQARVRGMLARMKQTVMVEEREVMDDAAVVIQAAWRAKTGRLAAHMRLRARHSAQMEAAALRVQIAWRGRQGRYSAFLLRRARAMHELDMENSARAIQRVWRGFLGRLEYRHRVFMAEADEQKKQSLLDWCALQIQRRWRGLVGRRRAVKMREVKARRWKQMWDDRVGRPFWYDKLSGEVRWRKPQEVLELEPRAPCSNCEGEHAVMECKDCGEFYCGNCFSVVHGGGKRKFHVFRALFDFYGKRIDYGDGEWPALWPSEVRHDELLGYVPVVVETSETVAEPAASAVSSTKLNVPGSSHIDELGVDPDVRHAVAHEHATAHGGGSKPKREREASNDGWVKVRDPLTAKEAYLDVKTGALSAERPIFFVTPRGDESTGEDGLPVFSPPPGEPDFPVPPGPGKARAEPSDNGWLKYMVGPSSSDESAPPGSVYYIHVTSGQSSWVRPEGYHTPRTRPDGTVMERGPPESGWSKFLDTSSGTAYYYNEKTGESTWERPTGFDTPRPQGVPVETLQGSSWAKYWSAEHAAPYWMDHVTGDSSWERPPGWQTPRVGDGFGVSPLEVLNGASPTGVSAALNEASAWAWVDPSVQHWDA
jgi:hypothetical protein